MRKKVCAVHVGDDERRAIGQSTVSMRYGVAVEIIEAADADLVVHWRARGGARACRLHRWGGG